ncbi:MAG: EAL domain-containing protein [Arenicellales bacterium]
MVQDNSSSRISSDFIDRLLDAAPVVLFATDRQGVITLSRGHALEALGLAQNELVGRSVFNLYTDEPKIAEAATRALHGETVVAQLTLNGTTHRTQFAPLTDQTGSVRGIVGVATDITTQVDAQRSLERLAHVDALTGLPNRNSLHMRVQAAVESVPVVPFAVAVVGLDRFRDVNHTFGYEIGDQAISQIAARLEAEFTEDAGEYCARSAGDEFCILVPGRDIHALQRRMRRRVEEIFQEPVLVRDQPLQIEASTGFAFFPGHGEEADKLIRRADTAMHIAKDTGLVHAIYEKARDEPRINNIQLVADLRRAIETDEVELHYQPQIEIPGRRIVGAEALFRWPRLREYGSHIGELMQVAERSGVIYLLDEWVLNKTVETYSFLCRNGQRVPIAANVSARTFQRPGFAREVAGLVEIWGMPPGDLSIEITETAMVHDHGQLQRTCEALWEAGIKVAIDDFGTGNSSLVYLKELVVSAIKVDVVFVLGLTRDETARTLVQSIIDMGNNLGVSVIAEGVEDDETLAVLGEMGCHAAQGFHIGRPMPLSQFSERLSDPGRADLSAGTA